MTTFIRIIQRCILAFFCSPLVVNLRSPIAHAFLSSVMVASIVVLLKSAGLLDRIKIITLNAIMSVAALNAPSDTDIFVDPSTAAGLKTYILTIDQQEYETTFNQSTPLDRSVLNKLFEEISKIKPRALAIDLDLSPNPNFSTENDIALSKTLRRMAKSGIEIILLIPNPVYSDEARERKLAWMLQLLKSEHIHFALGSLYTSDGLALKYIGSPSTISSTVQSIVSPNRMSETSKLPDHNFKLSYFKIFNGGNEYDQYAKDLNLLLNINWRNNALESDAFKNNLRPYNYRFSNLPSNQVIPLRWSKGSIDDLSGMSKTLRGQILFLGGEYGLTDYYNTAVGKQSGVKLHYAAYYSQQNPFKFSKYEHIVIYAIDILVGVFMSALLSALLYNKYLMGHFVFRIGVVFLVISLIFVLCFLAYYVLVNRGIWLNPAPVVIGILLHHLYEFVEGKTSHTTVNTHSNSANRNESTFYHRSDVVTSLIFKRLILSLALFYLLYDLIT